MEVQHKEQKQTKNNGIDAKQFKIGNRNPEFEIDDADSVRGKYVVEEHPVAPAKSEDMRREIQERQSKERHASEIRYPVTLYPEKAEDSIHDIEQGKQHRYQFQRYQHCLVKPLTS